MQKIIAFWLLCTIVVSCNHYDRHSPSIPEVKKTVIVKVLPLGNIPKEYPMQVYGYLKKVTPNVVLAPHQVMPPIAYYPPRSRYRADSIIRWMNRMAKPGEIFVAITSQDISTTKNGIKDWGIMGLGYRPGNACIASSFRLKDKRIFYKVVIHELAHTMGLPHCPVKTCYMRDAEGKDPTAMETGFCPGCRSYLKAKGWSL